MVALIQIFAPTTTTVEAFTAKLSRPWESSTIARRRNAAMIRFYVSKGDEETPNNKNKDLAGQEKEANRGSIASKGMEGEEQEQEEDLSLTDTQIPGSSAHVLASGTTVAATTASTPSISETPGSSASFKKSISSSNRTTELVGLPMPSQSSPSSSQTATTSKEQTMRSCLPDLIAMTRPSNLPGVVLFHLLGIYLTTNATGNALWKILKAPSMIVTLLALLLTSATSMLVNDYYDYKLGHDSFKSNKPLTTHKVSLLVVKRFLSYLYAAALFCVAAGIPGMVARTSVVTGLMLTFWYTQHLKPKTWLKNTVCASLIALSPFTSGAAAISYTNASWMNLTPLLRVTAMLFVGILGREITMDINDVDDDMSHDVRTVPGVYGRKFASTIGLLCNIGVAGFAMFGPVMECLSTPTMTTTVSSLRRLGMATVGSLALIRRSWQVCQSKGLDRSIVTKSVDEGLLTVVFLLASFL